MIFFKKNKIRVFNPVIERKERTGKKENSGKLKRAFYGLLCLIFLAVIFYSVLFSGFLTITEMKILGAEKTDPKAVKEAVFSSLSGRYLNIIPKNNIALVYGQQLENTLFPKFKLIKSLNIERKFPDSMILAITEKNPQMIMRAGESDYILDESGIVYPRSDFESDFLSQGGLLIFEDQSGKRPVEGQSAIKADYLNFILEAKKKLDSDLNIQMNREIKTPNVSSGDIIFETTDGWKIYFNKDISVGKEIDMLKAVLEGKIEKEKRKDLEYVDLRTDNKVYYKLK